MKALTFAACAVALGMLLAGCSYHDLTPAGSANRVLNAVVTNNTQADLPPNTEVIVRVVNLSAGRGRGEVLGEETIINPGRMPVAVRVEFTAEDLVLRRSVNVEARVAIDGQLRYMTTSAHPVALGNVNDTHVIEVSFVGKR